MRFVITQSTCYTNRFWNWNCLNLRNNNSQRLLTFDTSPTDIRMQVSVEHVSKTKSNKSIGYTKNITKTAVIRSNRYRIQWQNTLKIIIALVRTRNTIHLFYVSFAWFYVIQVVAANHYYTWIQKVIVNNSSSSVKVFFHLKWIVIGFENAYTRIWLEFWQPSRHNPFSTTNSFEVNDSTNTLDGINIAN